MEEQKNETKEIKMNAGEQEKLTHEQLNNVCVQLSQENQYLKQQLTQASKVLNTFNRLDYLFRVVECEHSNKNNSVSFASEFVEQCIREIQDIMTVPEEDNKGEEN